jgi:phenylpyruvate tautomerase PptA (4-oxalocrotonate tautomerase family)
MLFGGEDTALAYLQLKSIGLPESSTASLSAVLCELVSDHLGVAADRTYIEFQDVPRSLWGWNGATF